MLIRGATPITGKVGSNKAMKSTAYKIAFRSSRHFIVSDLWRRYAQKTSELSLKVGTYLLLFAFIMFGCTPTDVEETKQAEKSMTILGKKEASEILLDAIDNYKVRTFQTLVSEIGIGDDYYMIAEDEDGSKEGYSISIENEWHNQSAGQLVITATVYGPSPKEGGVVPMLHRESLVVEKY